MADEVKVQDAIQSDFQCCGKRYCRGIINAPKYG